MNLLTDPLLRVQTAASDITQMSLPELLSALGRDEVEGLPGLQRHQADALHVFLCYLAGAILARCADTNPVQEASYWQRGLVDLSEGQENWAWRLVVEDVSKPAFFQPPLPASDRLTLKAVTPDQLDLLPTAKNHDLKNARGFHPYLDEWFYAIVSLQTMSGFFGSGQQGISRMNSGYGNRSIVEIVHHRRPGGRWRDAVLRLSIHRKNTLEGPWAYNPEGLVLTWLMAWDGNTALRLKELDPFYLEICRRVRLRMIDDRAIGAYGVRADHPRLAAKELNGNVGDAWLPIDHRKDGTAALTLGSSGITADILRRILFEDGLSLTELQRPLQGVEGQVWLAVSVLIRGGGTTEGFREEWIPIPSTVRQRLFGHKERREPLSTISKAAIEFAGNLKNRVLKPAVFCYLQGGSEGIKLDRKSSQAWWDQTHQRYETLWNDDFFPWLWSLPEGFDLDEACKDWAARLRDHALVVLDETMLTMPSHTGHCYRAQTQAKRFFWGALYKHFPMLKENSHVAIPGK